MDAARARLAEKKELSTEETEEVGRLWRKLVKLYLPDRFASEPEMLDGVVAKQVVGLEAEIGKLTTEVERLAREIGELTGSGFAGL